jgi:hypothetical protein
MLQQQMSVAAGVAQGGFVPNMLSGVNQNQLPIALAA